MTGFTSTGVAGKSGNATLDSAITWVGKKLVPTRSTLSNLANLLGWLGTHLVDLVDFGLFWGTCCSCNLVERLVGFCALVWALAY